MSEESGGSKLRAFLADKGIDAILIPVGLFAALWFQNWVDNRKDQESYRETIGDFGTELQHNLGQVKALEEHIGPMTELETMGPMDDRFTSYLDEANKLTVSLQCADWILFGPGGIVTELADPATPTPDSEVLADAAATVAVVVEGNGGEAGADIAAPEGDSDEGDTAASTDADEGSANTDEGGADADPSATAVDADQEDIEAPKYLFPADKAARTSYCGKLLDEEDEASPPPTIDLSPFYQKVVWQTYTSNTIKLFKDPQAKLLGLSLGKIYAAQEEVERRVREIETLFNSSLMASSGTMDAMSKEFDDVFSGVFHAEGGQPTPATIAEARIALKGMVGRTLQIRYQIETARSVVLLNVTRLKNFYDDMNKELEKALASVRAEQARLN